MPIELCDALRDPRKRARLRRLRYAVILLLGAWSETGLAQKDAQTEARESFALGYRLVQEGKLEAGITAFERAYAASPHFSVLYNLAQAYAASGQVVRAVETFERYLSEGGEQVPVNRRSSVEEAIVHHSRRIGGLSIGAPHGSKIVLDGAFVGTAPLSAPLRVGAGTHALRVELAGHRPSERTVSVEGETEIHTDFRLEPERGVDVDVRCAVPDTILVVDGAALSLPSGGRALRLAPGPHRFEFSRAGYQSRAVTLPAADAGGHSLDCGLRIDPSHPENGTLKVLHPHGTSVHLNGAAFTGGRVPKGRHELEVTGKGYEPARRTIELGAGESQTVSVTPVPSASARSEEQERARRMRTVAAYVLGGTGLAAAGTAVALYVYDNGAHAEWRDRNRALLDELQENPENVSASELDALIEEENAIRDRDTIAVGLGVFGGALLAGALTLLVFPDPAPPAEMVLTGRRKLDFKLSF
jgi:hypothetical protein